MKKNINRIRIHLRYILWLCEQKIRGHEASKLYDINRTFMINPEKIKRSLNKNIDRLNEGKNASKHIPIREHGCVSGGEWDIRTVPFEELSVWKAFEHRFHNHGKWSDTQFYKEVTETIKGGQSRWNCKAVYQFDERLQELEKLYENIRDYGYRQQKDIAPNQPRCFGNHDEVHVYIDRNGHYLFADGRHRLCIAKLLELERIPVKVSRRHSEWVQLRQRILQYAHKHGGRIYAPITHPDLNDIPATHGNERFKMMLPHLKHKGGKALDIGAHWGYFSHCLSGVGYACTVIERDPLAVEFLQKLMIAEERHFEIIDKSVLEYRSPQEFEVVLALNIFHHFIKTKENHEKLIEFLQSLNSKSIFFQSHDPEEAQMKNAYRNYNPEEFAEFVGKNTGLESMKKIGTSKDKRELFMLH